MVTVVRDWRLEIGGNIQSPNLQPPISSFIAVGVFDGVHRGHQALLRRMAAEAKRKKVGSAILTFYPHPAKVIHGANGRLYLQRLEDRIACLGEMGIDWVIVHPFDEEVHQMPAKTFIQQLQLGLGLQQLWGGEFSLGHQRAGDYTFLKKLGDELDFGVKLFDELVVWEEERVSSTRIRRALISGDMETVSGCLGRHYTITAPVVEGRKMGRTIGFPTANLGVWAEQLMPANGVYAAFALIDNKNHLAAVNIGVRPTVKGSTLTIEAHLLDFDKDIYGQELTLQFVTRLRDEKKFAGLDELIKQIGADVKQVRQMLR